MPNDFKKIKTMGVINITPNSFSDPQKFFFTDELTHTLLKYSHRDDLLFDFGFESTAPMNSAITQSEELKRFDQFFEQIKDIDLNDRWISFDTYRPSSFSYFEERFKTRYKGQGFLFNDVSGVRDTELLQLLRHKKSDPCFFYNYSFTHIPSRDETLKHMTFLDEGDVVSKAMLFFEEAEKEFCSLGVNDQVVFDPCFGFSKTYEQNWELLNRFVELEKHFGHNRSWLIGLSKKSFLRKSLSQDVADPFLEAEKIHQRILSRLIDETSAHVFFRVHDFDIVNKAQGSAYA